MARMQRLINRRSVVGVPRGQTRPTRAKRNEVLKAVANAYAIAPGAVLNRSHQGAFRAAVHLLRRAANLPLNEVATLAGVSAPRISQTQSKIERETPDSQLQKLMRLYKLIY